MISSEEAKELIRLGRKAVEKAFEGEELTVPEEIKEKFSQKMGVFTTILTYPGKELRGCIGVPYPVYPLWYAVIDSSISAAFKDPRFEPLRPEEFYKVLWELSILTPPQKVDKEKLFSEIKVGRDGLIIEKGLTRGLLLPQVPVKYGWDVEEFLDYTCLKAGLPKGCWREEDTNIYKFQAQIFEEKEPLGDVVEVKIS